jgi:hypothetical protein
VRWTGRTILALLLGAALLPLTRSLLIAWCNCAPVKFAQIEIGMSLAEAEGIMGRTADRDWAVRGICCRVLLWEFPNGQNVHLAVDSRGIVFDKRLTSFERSSTSRDWTWTERVTYFLVSF